MNDFLLNLFTGTDENRPAMMFPNLVNGIVYATDTHALVAIPENELALKYGTNEKYPNAQKILDDFSKKELHITIIFLFLGHLKKQVLGFRIVI